MVKYPGFDNFYQIARVRQHGFSDREIAVVRAFLMADIESAYLEKDQMQSATLRDEYLQVFLGCLCILTGTSPLKIS